MNSLLRVISVTGLILASITAFADTVAVSGATPQPTLVPPMSTPTPLPLIAEGDKKKILAEFQKAYSNQRSAFAHQEKAAMKELAAAQSMRQKKWREEQKKLRQSYFDQHTSGPERREYVQTYQKKLQEFDAANKAEVAALKKSWVEKNQALKQLQKDREEKFNAALATGHRPPAELWPSGN